ncbi:diacylglycerol/lipid kinase family protein [Parapedomonas caeni]
MTRRVVIIANPKAGRRLGPALKVADRLTRLGADVRVEPTAYRGHAREIARALALSGAADVVAAAGGDGTAAEAMGGLTGTRLPLAIIPAGTANVMALTLGLPAGAEALARTVLDGTDRDFRPGLARDLPFLCLASAGFDAEAVRRVDLGLKRMVGKAAYAWAGLQTALAGPPARLTVDADGERLEGSQLIITRGPFYAGRHRLLPGADPFDDRLHLLLVTGGGRLDLARFVAAAALGRHTRLAGVVRRACQEIRVGAAEETGAAGRSSGRVAVEVDGDYLGHAQAGAPVIFGLARQTVRLRCPR